MKEFSPRHWGPAAVRVLATIASVRLMQVRLPEPPQRLARTEIGWQQDLPRPGTAGDDAFCPVGSGPGDRAGKSGR